MTNEKRIPFRVKVPIYLAVTLAFAAGLMVVFDRPEGKAPEMCRLESAGSLQKDRKGMSFVSHLFRSSDGNFYAGGLDLSSEKWELNRILFAADGSPYLEAVSHNPNFLAIGASGFGYRRLGSFSTVAFVEAQYEGRKKVFGVGASPAAISPAGYMDFCGKPWPDGTEVMRLNDTTALFWFKGQLGFYDLRNMGMLVPRGAGRSPETILGVSAGNLLSYMSCDNLTENTKAQVSAQEGAFAILSGDKPEISFYSVAASSLELEPLILPIQSQTFSQFKLLDNRYLAIKVSGLLESAEKWEARLISDFQNKEKAVSLFRPVSSQRLVNEEGQESGAELWILEEERRFFLWKKHYLTKLVSGAEAQRYVLPVEVTGEEAQLLWRVLPGDKHLFVSDKSGDSTYDKVACP